MMRIATFNCNSVRQRLPIILDWLESYQPDVLALQETKVTDDQFPAFDFLTAGWKVVYAGQKSYNGVALVSRQELENVSAGLQDGDDGESNSRLISGRLQGVSIVNTYVPQGKDFDSESYPHKLAWYRRLRRYLEERHKPTEPLIWLGDLNVAPEAADVHNSRAVWPHVCHCQETTDAFRGVMSWGLRDVVRDHYPEAALFTYFDYRAKNAVGENKGWRIDHILATSALADACTHCAVDTAPRQQLKPSDHTFLYADFAQI